MKRIILVRTLRIVVAGAVAALGAACYGLESPATPDTGNDAGVQQPDASVAKDAAPPPPQQLPSGRALVGQNCAVCHTGPAGELAGNDSPVSNTTAYAPNITPDKDTGIGDWTDDELIRAIRTGMDDQDQALCSTMPRFTEFSDPEIKAMVAYIRGVPAVNHQVQDSICPPLKDDDDDGGDDGGDDDGPDTDDDAGIDAGTDASDAADDAHCSDYVPPDASAPCHTTQARQPNGCYNGYFCKLSTVHCVPPPWGC